MKLKHLGKHKLMAVVIIIYLLLLAWNPSMAQSAFKNSRYYLVEMLQIMPVIYLLTVSIDVLVPKEWILKHLGETSGLKGSLLALVFGSVSAGPIYAAFPVTKMLLKKGASVGNVVVILSAWAVIKVPMLANEAKFLGLDFMITRWLLTVVAILFMGWFMNRTVKVPLNPVNAPEASSPVMVNDSYCIGCGLCAAKLPEVFRMEEGKAISLDTKPLPTLMIPLQQVTQKCPARAITLNIPKEN